MSIAHFVYHLDKYSGAAFQALLLAEHLPEHEHLFFNLCNAPVVKEHKKGARITVIDLPSNKLTQFLEVTKRTRSKQVPIFHLHGFIILALLVGILFRKRIILKTTLYGHDDFAALARSRFGAIKLFLARRVDRNIVLSEPLRRVNEQFLPATKILKIPNGIHLPKTPPSSLKDKPIFCSVGVISERKATLDVIRYFLAHYAAIPGSRLYLVGPHSVSDGIPEVQEEYVEQCQREIASSRYSASIVMTGKIAQKEVEEIYKQSIAHLFFSQKEGLPNVILESMAFNCVPIMKAIDGIASEIVEEGKNGFIIDDISTAIPIERLSQIVASGAVWARANDFDICLTANRYRALCTEMSP